MSLPAALDPRHWTPSLRIAAPIAVLIVTAGLLAQVIQPAGTPSASFASQSPAPGSIPPGSPAPTSPEPILWEPVSLAAFQPLADLTAARSDASGVAADTSFTLRSTMTAASTTVSASTLALGLTSSPRIKFRVSAGATPDVATLVPATPLVAGTRYRIRLAAPDGSLAGTWSFQTAGPLHVTGLLPANRTTGVPVRTGIEVTFDQDDPIDFQAHFKITPDVQGRFEVHDRTWVFVPTNPLEPGTLYTYTVRAGVAMKGSTETLEKAVTASFETAAPTTHDPSVRFDRIVFDIRTGARPLLGLWIDGYTKDGETELPAPTSLPAVVYRFPTATAAAAAVSRLAATDDWLTSSAAGLVSTEGLTKVASFDGLLTDRVISSYVLHAPVTLDPGLYLIVVPRDGRDAQAVIQVTDLATYGLSSTTRTIVWLNDLKAGTPVVGATVSLPGSGSLGSTDADGLLDIPTPAALQTEGENYSDATARVLIVRTPGGRTSLVPLGARSDGHYAYNDPYSWSPGTAWWTVFSTDRANYRSTDTIHAWGFVRSRDTRAVPHDLAVRLVTGDGTSTAAIVSKALHPTARGTFVTDVAIRDLPLGSYQLQLLAGSEVVATAWLDVSVIRKPAFQLDVTTDHRAYLTGSPIKVTATASFFDGTTSPGVDLRFGTWDYGTDTLAVAGHDATDALGRANVTLTAKVDGIEGASSYPITVVPSSPEEGEIRSDQSVYVFPSSVWLTSHMKLSDGKLHISGTTQRVDIPTVDRALELNGDVPVRVGPAIAGQTVTVRVVHKVPVRRLVRTEYDYLEKVTVPIYEYSERDDPLGTWTLTSATDGSFALSVAVPNADHSYEVTLTSKDVKGRTIKATLWQAAFYNYWVQGEFSLDGPDQASVGQAVDLVAHDQAGATLTGTYLYIVGSDGIRDAQVRSDGTFSRTFAGRDLPGFSVRAVRLTTRGLEVSSDHTVQVKSTDKIVHVKLTPDQERYQPGDTATIAIRTTDQDGQPIAADVVVRAIDQKLYSMGAAWDASSRGGLYEWIGPGFLKAYVSAFAPIVANGNDGGRGGGGSGGGRQDFRDVLTFQLVSTDADGRASISFRVSDDLTSWHVAASAFTAGLDAGDGVVIVPVGLPFFVDATLAPTYLAGEQPVLRLRAYGDSLRAGDDVRFTVTAPALGIDGQAISGTAFIASRLTLPALPAGDIRVTIVAHRVGSATLTDTLTRTIHVVPNRLTMLRTTYQDLAGSFTPTTGVGITTYLVTDAGRGALIPLLQELAQAQSARFDRQAAAEAARAILRSTFELPLDDLAASGFDPTRYQNDSGVALLPYASTDPALAAEAALVVPDQINARQLRSTLRWFLDPSREDVAPVTREQAIVANVALAGLEDDVLDELHVIEASADRDGLPLSVPERLWLALGYLASGDEAAARSIERDVLATAGRAYGPWVRLEVTPRTDLSNGLMLLLAGSLGDPISTKVERYITDHPSTERSYALEELGYAKGMLDRLPRAAGSFAWTVDGQRHVETLEPGGSFTVALTPDQQRTLSFERIAGALTVTTSAVTSATPSDLPSSDGVTISRTVSPAANASESAIVRVSISVTVSRRGPGCFTVTDLVPSGLAPIAAMQSWPDDPSVPSSRAAWPYRVDGQRVEWCFDPNHPTSMTYLARVVSPGTYTWEPAVVQDSLDTSVGAATATTTYTID